MANLLVLVSYNVFPAHMGGQKGIVKFYEHLMKHHTVYMAVSFDNGTGSELLAAEKMLYNNRKLPLNVFRLAALKKKIREKNIDCVIAEHSYTGWLAWLLKKWTGTPFIIHSHNIETSRFRQMGKKGWTVYRQYEKWIHQKADFSFFKTEEEMGSAMHQFVLPASKCAVVPYGIEPFKKVAGVKGKLAKRYGIKSTCIFYFNGTLDYVPNVHAVEKLIEKINPVLETCGVDYTLLISGKRTPSHLLQKMRKATNVRYLGFVEDMEMLYQAATLFLNPVVNDSGVKTKVVEALANHCTVVSTKSGAAGVREELCGRKLIAIADNDWEQFAATVLEKAHQRQEQTPGAFFVRYAWKNIAATAAIAIEEAIRK